jgi:large subunit ribosomal protein L30
VAEKIKVTLVKSLITRPESQRRIIKSLGLTKLHSSVIHEDTPQIRGMIRKVSHLLAVEEIGA